MQTLVEVLGEIRRLGDSEALRFYNGFRTWKLTYAELYRQIASFAAYLDGAGLGKGDRVIIYMPMCPETAIAMLACARIGAIHSVIFGGFSSEAIKDRINDSQARLVITADGGYRRGAIIPLKKNVDDALADGDQIERVIVFRRAGNEVQFKEGRDVWWHEEMRQGGVRIVDEDVHLVIRTSEEIEREAILSAAAQASRVARAE